MLRLHTADYIQKNRKDAASQQGKEMTYRSAHSQEGQNIAEICSHGEDWLQNAYDMVPQTWITEGLKMYKISD